MEIGSITSQYFWRNDQFIQREVKTYEYPNGGSKEIVSELVLYDRHGQVNLTSLGNLHVLV